LLLSLLGSGKKKRKQINYSAEAIGERSEQYILLLGGLEVSQTKNSVGGLVENFLYQ
jgi:hypothetical protein